MKESLKYTQTKVARRAKRVRARINGTHAQPRMSLSVSNRHITVQFIDDVNGKTLLSVHDGILGVTHAHPTVLLAHDFGKKAGELARAKGIDRVVLDRGGRLYHGRIAAFAEGAREGGLKF